MVRAILSAPGSRGDVNPMIAIGKRLRQLGYDVVISLAEPYAEIAAAAGLEVEPVVDRQRFSRIAVRRQRLETVSRCASDPATHGRRVLVASRRGDS